MNHQKPKSQATKKIALLVFILYLFVSPVGALADKRVLIFGLDDTGSYTLRERAITIAAKYITDLRPGDVLYARRITDKSYTDSCAIFRLEIPKIGNPPSNNFDKKARYRWQKKAKSVSLLKVKAVDILAKLKPIKAKKTDIWGFLAAAADRIKVEEGFGRKPLIIVASDMKDNCRRKLQLDLKRAEILVVGFETGEDPRAAQKIKSEWTKALQNFRASKVLFLPPDVNLAGLEEGK